MMFEVLNLFKEMTILKVLRMKKTTNRCEKKSSIQLVHVFDSMDELRQLSMITVMLIKFSS